MKSSCFWNIREQQWGHKLNLLLPQSSLLTVYKCFIRPHQDYADMIYNQPDLSSLVNKIKSVQKNVALAIISAIR